MYVYQDYYLRTAICHLDASQSGSSLAVVLHVLLTSRYYSGGALRDDTDFEQRGR